MQDPATTDPRGALCTDASPRPAAPSGVPGAQPLFPPKDADAETRRRWLASSPWPEVVFAAAG
ncbi:MAG TPA: hypothetical protein VES93_11435 [Ornithinibacter sp.]|nr:hypothetical protein [Ornithinibacter sp.]